MPFALGSSSPPSKPKAWRRLLGVGLRPLREIALKWVMCGETTLEEVERVAG